MPASQNARLVCLSGPDAGTEYELSEEQMLIGRSTENSVVVNDGFASRQHAELHYIDDAFRLHDLKARTVSLSMEAVSRQGRRPGLRTETSFSLPQPATGFTTHRPRSRRRFSKPFRRRAYE